MILSAQSSLSLSSSPLSNLNHTLRSGNVLFGFYLSPGFSSVRSSIYLPFLASNQYPHTIQKRILHIPTYVHFLYTLVDGFVLLIFRTPWPTMGD